MEKLYRIIIVLSIAICFAGFAGDKTGAQPKTAVRTTPTPKPPATRKPAKDSVKPTSKTTAANSTAKRDERSAKTAANFNPTPVAAEQIIVAATASQIRQQPKNKSAQLSLVKLGKLLPVSEKNAAWYRVEYAEGKSGWISKTIVKDYEIERRDDIYREITDKYFKGKPLDFATAAEVSDFLRTARVLVKADSLKADLSLRRLRVLTAALKAIPFGKGEQFPYTNFLKANEKDVVYSEPSAEWLVRSEVYWELRNKYTALPIAEEIAWEAAQNPIPGECEGDVNCQLYVLRATDGEYLNLYPNGKYSKKALSNITDLLEPIVADLNGKSVYTLPNDISDRAEFNRFLTELRAIISRMSDAAKTKTLQQINQLDEGK